MFICKSEFDIIFCAFSWFFVLLFPYALLKGLMKEELKVKFSCRDYQHYFRFGYKYKNIFLLLIFIIPSSSKELFWE